MSNGTSSAVEYVSGPVVGPSFRARVAESLTYIRPRAHSLVAVSAHPKKIPVFGAVQLSRCFVEFVRLSKRTSPEKKRRTHQNDKNAESKRGLSDRTGGELDVQRPIQNKKKKVKTKYAPVQLGGMYPHMVSFKTRWSPAARRVRADCCGGIRGGLEDLSGRVKAAVERYAAASDRGNELRAAHVCLRWVAH
ncbi:hypothetical protein DFH07DRAFT_785341 [Mycena maculata]|uniref:Uncharacterized protein n=1 Tax=Mycena maculata TaxID=230809 RepID=A0AAD7HC56_9AGAR|nr:hypothetical protein DFH07DRAFT_785341 [Mycena maculata]